MRCSPNSLLSPFVVVSLSGEHYNELRTKQIKNQTIGPPSEDPGRTDNPVAANSGRMRFIAFLVSAGQFIARPARRRGG